MRSLPTDLTAEFLKEAIHLRHLLTLTFSTTYHWTDCNNSIFYSGIWYDKKSLKFSPAIATISSEVDSIEFEIANVDKAFSDLALSEDLRGKECRIERVLLDKNLDVVGAPSLLFLGYVDAMEIDRRRARVQVYNHMIKWKTLTPRRVHSPTCPWVFKGTECGYTGIVKRNPTSDYSVQWLRSHGSLNYANLDDQETDLTRGCTASADSVTGGAAANAFDDDTTTNWATSASALPHWLKCQFSAAKIINLYKITIDDALTGYSPKSWIFQGSNDGTTWIDLDLRNNIYWSAAGEEKTFSFVNATAYAYYRIYVLMNQSGTTTAIAELDLFGPSDQYNDSDYNYTASTSEQADLFGFSPIDIGPDATIYSVQVIVRAKQDSAGVRSLKCRLRVEGANYDHSTIIVPATSFGEHTRTWPLNPKSGVAWTVNDIEQLGSNDLQAFGYVTAADAGGHTIRISQCRLQVLTNETSCDYSKTRCKELNNQDNFGGFSHISDLAQKEVWWGTKQKIWGDKV